MKDLQSSWLGSWRAPWGLDRGRRWGDPAWALAAIAQAWMMGGGEGRWPRASWAAKRPGGPWVETAPEAFESLPSPEWISLLRHGSHGIPPMQRGRTESDLVHHCWTALLQGDGAPWMALGSVLFDRKTRTRWIPVLGAVDESGTLHVPPFLEPLVPPWLRHLPEGWWAFLLSRTDPSGTLLPEGPLPRDFPWSLLEPEGRDCLDPFVLDHPPRILTPAQRSRWMVRLKEDAWMLDPRLRAWGRGQGAGPETLMSLVPPSIALGDAPSGSLADLLAGPSTTALPAPVDAYGYPPPKVPAHPCADPFHWLGEGLHATRADEALRAFRWAHGHFGRLDSPRWARRAASEAAAAALAWGDLPAAETWRSLRGFLSAENQALEEAELTAARGDWEGAAALARKLAQVHPDLCRAWLLIARSAILLDHSEWIQEALLHMAPDGLRKVLEAIHGGGDLAPGEDLEGETGMLWTYHRARHHSGNILDFWCAWEQCPHQPLRMEAGLRILEGFPEQRTASRLLELRSLADRSEAPIQKTRLASLWPSTTSVPEPAPLRMLEDWLRLRTGPTWLTWGPTEHPSMLGTGDQPPEGILRTLHENGGIEPLGAEGRTWWGHPLHWEGIPVGSILMAVEPDEPMGIRPETHLIAPWLARLAPVDETRAKVSTRLLLTDGSEPMASVLAELARVAPSELPVLILGPTGSGKELTAREIHERSGRKGPFRPVNCSEYAETLLESELFGHTKGAFTGADRERKGAIESAEGGTLFLDEVADLSPRLQSLFLRVLQEKEIRRVGSDRVHRVDVRFLAATHRSLEHLVAAGSFRRDLLFRMKGAVLLLPSLRERRHEFPYLIPRLTLQIAKEAGLPMPELAAGLPRALARLPWPGNVRELRHAIERALLRCTEGTLKVAHFPELDCGVEHARTWEEGTREYQRGLLLAALQRHGFKAAQAALELGLTRPALYLTAKRLAIDLVVERERWEADHRAGRPI